MSTAVHNGTQINFGDLTQDLSQWVQLWTGAQINFCDLTQRLIQWVHLCTGAQINIGDLTQGLSQWEYSCPHGTQIKFEDLTPNFNLYEWNQPQLAGHAPIILIPGAGGTTCRNITDDHHQPKDDSVWVCPGAPPLSAHNAVRKEPRADVVLPHFLAKNLREFTMRRSAIIYSALAVEVCKKRAKTV